MEKGSSVARDRVLMFVHIIGLLLKIDMTSEHEGAHGSRCFARFPIKRSLPYMCPFFAVSTRSVTRVSFPGDYGDDLHIGPIHKFMNDGTSRVIPPLSDGNFESMAPDNRARRQHESSPALLGVEQDTAFQQPQRLHALSRLWG